MHNRPPTDTTITPLEETIARRINERTWGRIHRLQVELIDDRIVVRGRTSTYYSKQLALEGVLDVVGTHGSPSVELNIDVGTQRPELVNA